MLWHLEEAYRLPPQACLRAHTQDAPCQKTPCLSEQFVMDIELLVLGPELLYCKVSTEPS
jgi:hypothetical protein